MKKRKLTGRGRRRRKKPLKGGWAVLARILPWLRKIPNFFRSPMGKKVATTLAKAGVSTGLNIAADKLASKGTWKEIGKQRGKEAAIDLLGKAKAGLEGSGRGRGRRGGRRRGRKQIKGGARRKRRAVKIRRGKKRRSTRRLRRSIRTPDIFD